MEKDLNKKVKNIYDLAKSMQGNEVKYDNDPYHRDFLHIAQTLVFIDSHSSIQNYNTVKGILNISMLLHDISNLYTGYDKHEYKIIFELIELEESIGFDSLLSLQIKNIYDFKPVLVKSLKARKIQKLVKNLIKQICFDNKISDMKFFLDTLKIFILATDFSYMKDLNEDQKELTDNLFNQIIFDKTIPNRKAINKIILTRFVDDEYENFLNFSIYDKKLLNILNEYKKKYIDKFPNPELFVHYIRFADLSTLFSLERYEQIENQLFKLLTSNDEHFDTKDIESQRKTLFRVNSSQLKLLLNVLIFNLRLSNLEINLLNKDDFNGMESLISLLSARCWKNY